MKIGLLPRIIIAIILGVVFGSFLPLGWVRVFGTFCSVFSQFLGFMVPLIIIGLVAPAISDIGRSAGRLLLWTVVIAYADTVLAGLLAYGTSSWLFPSLVDAQAVAAVEKGEQLQPYFQLQIPAIVDVMGALVFSFLMGIGMAYTGSTALKKGFSEFREIISKTIAVAIIPLLPLYICGLFVGMTYTGEAYHILSVFAKIICVIFALHIIILLYEFLIAGGFARRNPFRLLVNMLPAYFTALGTASSAATIPVTLRQTIKNGVSEKIAGFTVPLCATIHMSGSMMKIVCCAFAVCLIGSLPHEFPLFLHFIMLLAICMVAGPGVPGGAIMAALGPLAGILGFNPEAQALMIALYIAMDSFGTACNVTGDGAISVLLDKIATK
jgi:Na+/H+-dicarboxylate symporter